MVVSAYDVRFASKLVSAACAVAVAAYSVCGVDVSAGFWGAAWGCLSRTAGILPWWADALYGLAAAVGLAMSAASGRLLWGMAVSGSRPERVTLACVALWAVLIPADVAMLLVAWPFMLGRVTIMLTRPK